MTDQAYNLRAADSGPDLEGTPGNVLTFQSDGKVRGVPLPPPDVTSVFGREGAIVGELGDYPASLIVNDSPAAGADLSEAVETLLQRPDVFGTGSDGNLIASSGTTTLTRDTYYALVRLTGTAKLITAGYKLFIQHWDASNAPAGAIDYSGNQGGDATTGTSVGNDGGPALAAHTVGGSLVGAIGGDGVSNGAGQAGGNAGSVLLGCGGQGGDGGAGGTGGNGAGGAGGLGGPIGTRPKLHDGRQELALLLSPTTYTQVAGGSAGGGGASGGGGGAGHESGPGGGSASAGGVVYLRVGKLTVAVTTAAGACRAVGGRGGNGAASEALGFQGGGSGGGGGGGGWIHAIVGEVEGPPVANFFDASGGNGGAAGAGVGGGTSGLVGVGGEGGEVVLLNIAAGTALVSTRGAASGQVGGVARLAA